jgi:hypothetical protein
MFQEQLSANYESRKNKLLKNLEEFDIKNSSIEKINYLLADLNEFYQLVSATKFNLEFSQNNRETIETVNKTEEEKIIKEIIEITSIDTEEIKIEEVVNPEVTEPSIQLSEAIQPKTEKIISAEPLPINEIKSTISENIIKPESVSKSAQNNTIKKIEFGINDKFRIINELFGQSQIEFNTAVEQLNSCVSIEESENYLNNLKIIYNWKSESQLVKTFFALNHKRFN